MTVTRIEPRAVVMRRCPICGYIMPQADVSRLTADIPCPRCGKVKTDKFGPIYESVKM